MSHRLRVSTPTAVQRVAIAVDAALRELERDGNDREQTVGLDLVRRRLRRDLDRVAVSQEWAA